MSRSALAFATLLVIAWRPSVGHADVVFPQRHDCPDGSEPVFCHGLPTCRALLCATDADCTGGARCQEASFCRMDRPCGGPSRDPVHPHLDRTCDLAAPSCAAGLTCEAARVCRGGASPAPPAGPVGASGVTTAASETGTEDATSPWVIWGGVAAASVVAVLVALWMTRNRRAAPML